MFISGLKFDYSAKQQKDSVGDRQVKQTLERKDQFCILIISAVIPKG